MGAVSIDNPLKRCTKCGIEYPATAEYFHRCPKNKSSDGLRSQCKECRKAPITKEKELLQNQGLKRCCKLDKCIHPSGPILPLENFFKDRTKKDGHSTTCKFCVGKHRIEWRDANPERQIASSRRLYLKNRETIRAKQNIYRKEHPDRCRPSKRAAENRRRARKLASTGQFTAQDVQRQYERQKRRCYYCATKVGKKYHVDHVVPLSRGGSNTPENIVITCPDCNLHKKNKLPHEWAEGGRLL